MIYIIIGKTGSGKTFIKDKIVQNKKYTSIVEYTTRDPRESEKNGVDYNFVTDEEFDKMYNNNEFFDTRSYNVVTDNGDRIIRYGNVRINDYANKSYIVVTGIEGMMNYIKQYGRKNCKIILVKCSDSDTRYDRISHRPGFNKDEYIRRMKEEDFLYDKIEVNKNCDIIIDNR